MNLEPIQLSIAAPAYNEKENIQRVVTEWREFLLQQSFISEFEIIVCNDGSNDETGTLLNTLSEKYSEVRALHHPKNRGAASALATAISATRFEWVLLLDSDGQFSITNLPAMLGKVQETNAAAAIGIRNKQDHLIARVGSQVSGIICNFVHGSKIKDFNSAFKLVHGPLLRSLSLEAKGMNYSTEITSRLLEKKVTIIGVDIDHLPRKMGKSSVKWIRDGFHRLLFVSYIAFRQFLLKLEVIKRE